MPRVVVALQDERAQVLQFVPHEANAFARAELVFALTAVAVRAAG